MKKIIHIIAILLFSQYSFAQQNIGINTETPDSSAILDIESTEKGILIPRLTSLQRLAIDSPANSLMVFDLDESAIFYFSDTASAWLKIPDKSEIYWNIKNNNIYNVNIGKVGIGTDDPQKNLHIRGNGSSNPGIAITNGDSSYSIIIIIDELDGTLAWQGWNGLTPKDLVKIDSTGRMGVGTNPSSTLHLKSQNGSATSMRLSNTSSNDIIIIIDELDGTIKVKDENSKELFSSDKLARFGIGKEVAKNTLHIYSDTLNPSIRLEREGYLFDYIFGFHESSSAFVLQRDSVVGGNSDIFGVDTLGDVSITSNNAINLQPGITTGSIAINGNGNTVNLDVDINGNLTSSAPIISSSSISKPSSAICVSFAPVTINSAADVYPVFDNNDFAAVAGSIYDYTLGTDSLRITESGTYQLSYNLNFEKLSMGNLNFATSIDVNGVNKADTRDFEYMSGSNSTTFYFSTNLSMVMYFNEDDVIRFVIDIFGFNNNAFSLMTNSNFSLTKISDN
ncbi:MAG: hypothetical protein R2772_03790 [Chitinophagales bacterium]|nr:hypothetical protein [Erysipelotrichaceae bacterium]